MALIRHGARPSEQSAIRFFRQVTVDLGGVRQRMGERWEPFLAYSLDRARTASVQLANRRLLREFGLPQIPPEQLARITVPTSSSGAATTGSCRCGPPRRPAPATAGHCG